MIPLLDIQAQHEEIRAELDAAVARVMAHGRFVGGPEIAGFEVAFAGYCGVDHCVGVGNGTDGLTLTLVAAGIGSGDEVITTPLTFVATAEAILATGATPVFVDPDPATGLISVAAAEAAIGPRTAALLPVHLYGQPVDLDGFRALADRRGLFLLEDAAQAHGALAGGRRAGSVGDAAVFSFFPGKNLGALGDAGAVTTSDAELAGRLRRLRDHGRTEKYSHEIVGTSSRLDTVHAAVLLVKLERLETWNDRRREHAAAYDAAFADVDGIEPIARGAWARPVYHQYVIRGDERDRLQSDLRASGVATGIHYPVPLHRQPALEGRFRAEPLPNAQALADTVLSLPVYPELDARAQEQIVEAVLASRARRPAQPRAGVR